MSRVYKHTYRNALLAGLLASSIGTFAGFAETAQVPAQAAQPQLSTTDSGAIAPSAVASPSLSGNWHAREGGLYSRNWGVDIIGVRRAAAGEMLVFRYRILDVEKAKALNDNRKSAYLIDERTGTRVSVPQMEKVGSLRTTTTPQANRDYWMVFPNAGNLVKAGSRVSVVIGEFRVDGLVVDSK